MIEFLLFFLTIILSEFGDKTQLVILSLASKTKHKLDVFWGAFFAFIFLDGIAIFFGVMLSNMIPKDILIGISSMIFLIYGALTFLSSGEDIRGISEDKTLKVIFSVFLMVALAELGDKSQIASIFFATQFPGFIVFLAVILILSIMTLITIYLSHALFETLSSKIVHRISGLLFIAMGIFTLVIAFA